MRKSRDLFLIHISSIQGQRASQYSFIMSFIMSANWVQGNSWWNDRSGNVGKVLDPKLRCAIDSFDT